tara:strand:- start:1049 stop:2482 length:1434 start_codon:yes stop_codon:yes gene_type:complete
MRADASRARTTKADIARDLDREITRKTYFDNRPDISDDRLDRRRKQAEGIASFKEKFTKPVNIVDSEGNVTGVVKGLTQAKDATVFDTDSSSPTFGQYVTTTVADERMRLANKYGPTFSEIMSDVTYAGGKILGAMGEKALSGGLGFLGAINEVIKYGYNKATDGYNKLNDVQKEIIDNEDKYTLASQIEKVKQVKNFRDLVAEAEKDLGFISQPGSGYQAGAGLTALPTPKISVESAGDDYVESGDFKRDLEKSGIISVDDPNTQEPLPDSTKIPGREQTIGDLKKGLEDQGFDELQIQSVVNQITRQIIAGEYTGDVEVETGSTIVSDDDQASLNTDRTQVTKYNNPLNLTDVGQAGTTGETYGEGFAVFPDAETGIAAAKNDLKIKTDRYDGDVEKIIGEFAPKETNPDSFDNYVSFVKEGVGDKVDPGEEDELLKRFIRFENKPDIADRYLAMVAEGGLMDKKMYGGIISSKK